MKSSQILNNSIMADDYVVEMVMYNDTKGLLD